MKEQREQWMQKLTDACDGDFSRVLFLDETGAMTNLIRSHGRSDQGKRCVAFTPNGHWKVLTAVGAAIRRSTVSPPRQPWPARWTANCFRSTSVKRHAAGVARGGCGRDG